MDDKLIVGQREAIADRQELPALRNALANLLEACKAADAKEDLSLDIDGSLLDEASDALDLQYPIIWTAEQVAQLNAGQEAEGGHPYTCGGNRGDAVHVAQAEEDGTDNGQLIATRRGWICPACDYRQFWAHGIERDHMPAATPTPVSAAVEERALDDDGVIRVPVEHWQTLVDHIENPPQPTQALIDLMRPDAQPIRAGVREALLQIQALPGEINTNNYDHDDVCALNASFIEGYNIATAALATPDDALTERAGDLTARVRRLVIAARVFWDLHDSEMDETARDLDRALEEFASEIPYEDQPDVA